MIYRPVTICMHAFSLISSFGLFLGKVKTPIMSSKFLLLKYLDISLVDVQLYRQDYLSLVSFLEASPALETFMLRVSCILSAISVKPLKVYLGTLCTCHDDYSDSWVLLV